MSSPESLDVRPSTAAARSARAAPQAGGTIDITPTDNGPYLVEGPVRIIDADCNEYDVPEQTTIALCRCGGSRTKPFCDGTHEKTNFKAINRAADSTTHQPVAVMLS